MNSKVKLLAAFTVFAAGLASLFLVDLFVSKLGSVEDISLWAFLRSSVMLAGFVVLLGCDQALIRNAEKIDNRIMVFLLGGVVVLSIPAAYMLSRIRDDVNFWAVFSFVLAVALSGVTSSYYRGALKLIRAQGASNNWKWLFLIFLITIYSVYSSVELLSALVMASFVVVVVNIVLLFGMYIDHRGRSPSSWPLRSFYSDGLRFLLMGGTLNLSVNLEQVLLNQAGTPEDGAYLFSYITAFGAVFILANGFYGFVLGPYAKKNKTHIFSNYVKFLLVNGVVGTALLVFASGVGVLLYDFLYADKFELRWDLVALVLLVFGFRFLYVIPSALIGFVGSVEVFNKYLAANVLSLGVFISLFFLINNFFQDGVLAILLASLVNWIIRVSVGLYLIQKNVVTEKT